MGSYATAADWFDPGDEPDEPAARLGDVVSGRLADVEVGSVEVEQERVEDVISDVNP